MPCSLLHIDALGKPRRLGLLGASVNKNKYSFLVDLVAHFLKLYVDYMRKWSVAMKIGALGNWFLAHNFLKKYFDLYFYAWIVANRKTRRSSPCAWSVRKN